MIHRFPKLLLSLFLVLWVGEGCMLVHVGNSEPIVERIDVEGLDFVQLMGHILGKVTQNDPEYSIEIVIRLRDRRSALHPEAVTLTTQDVLAHYASPKPDIVALLSPELRDTALACDEIPFASLMELVGGSHDFEVTVAQAESQSYRIGLAPSELKGGHTCLSRFIYQVPKGKSDYFKKVPLLLPCAGPGLAFDPQTRILTIIDSFPGSVSDSLAEALGCELLKILPYEPM